MLRVETGCFVQWPLTKKKDWRPAGSFSNCSGQEMGFFRSGFTMASLKTEGKTPVCRDWLMTAVTAGSSCSKHSTKRDIGSGSSEHVFWEDCKIMFLMRQVKKSGRKIGCMGHLLVGLAQAFDCLVHCGLFWFSKWNSQQMRLKGHKWEGQLEEASQSYNPEVHYKHQTPLCNSYSLLTEKRSNWTWPCAQCL